jgi:hypothetical protein
MSAEQTRDVLRRIARQEHWKKQGLVPPCASRKECRGANRAAWRKRAGSTRTRAALLWLARRGQPSASKDEP